MNIPDTRDFTDETNMKHRTRRVTTAPITENLTFAPGDVWARRRRIRTGYFTIDFLGRTSPRLIVNGRTGETHWIGALS